MADAAAKLAAEIADLKRRISAMERGQQFQHSTIDVGGEELILPEALGAGVDALAAADEALLAASELGTRLSTAEEDLTASGARLDAAEADIIDAFGRVDAAQATATDATLAASAAQTQADAANSAAATAATAAANAAGIANGKGKVLIQSTAPAAEDRNPVTLWIDTTGGANTPKKWTSGTTWTAVTDKAATDAATAAANAASAASAADAKAQSALTAAGSAQTTADSALTMAGTKGKVFYSTSAPSGTGTATGDLWRQIDGSKNVTGEWYWTGSLWQTSQITTSAISNLDVGKLTAGAAAIQTLTAQKIAASTASFQTVDVKNLFATSGTLDTAVISKLWTEVVNSQKITTGMLVVGSFDNLITEPDMSNGGKGWNVGTIVAGAGMITGNALRMTMPASGNYSSSSQPGLIPTEEGRVYRLTAWAKPSVDAGVNKLRIVARGRLADGSSVYPTYPANSTIAPAGVWTQLTGNVKMPAGVVNVTFYVEIGSGYPAGATVDWDRVSATRAADGKLIVDGDVTASKLESKLVLASEVIAGNPNGNHAKLDGNGFRVMAPPSDGAAPAEVIRLGTETDDYFGVVGADGNLTASITAEGGIAAKEVTIANSLSLGGEDLGSRIDYMPQRLVAWGQVPIDTNAMYLNPTGSEIGLFELGWDSNQPDGRDSRMYLFNVNNLLIRSSAVGQVGLRLRYTTDGTAPTVNSPVIQYSYGYVGVANGYTSFNINRIIGSNNGDYIRVLVTLWSGVSATVSVLKDTNQTHIYSTVVDLGASTAPTAVASGGGGTNGGAAPPPPSNPTVTTTKEWKATATRSFVGSGGTYAYNTGYMYSGLSPAGYGDLSSMAVFPSLTSTLSGATINDVWIYVYYDFWYYGSGGNAAISLHGESALTGSKPGTMSFSMMSNGWPRAAGRWVRLPNATYNGFKTGQWKGFALGGHNGGYTEYGYAHDARIKIRYTK
ncbi:minor tail protein [Arthrobacter phage Iter]|uniref:Minor tail protein n=1 Tax=Arthrobacter phage Ascela TaxID=3038360 RepID=A0AAF0GMU1_9CAUD|nr:minor tail protein [Arthrobacter phage Iter]WGH21543.1 minor tail protein [Arthrobacter phage Ascela]